MEPSHITTGRRRVYGSLKSTTRAKSHKAMEKKRAVDEQKKELWRMFGILFVFLATVFGSVVQSTSLRCRHIWAPTGLCLLASSIFFVGMTHSLKRITALKKQRRGDELTLAVATNRLREIKSRTSNKFYEEDLEVEDQEPGADAIAKLDGKFHWKWIKFTSFLVVTFVFVVISFIVNLCASGKQNP